MKAGPPATTFDLEVTLGMEPMHNRTQNRKSVSPDTVGNPPAVASFPPGFLHTRGGAGPC